MARALLLLLAAPLLQDPAPPPAAMVVAAVAKAAAENAALPVEERRKDDALGDLYVRAAAEAAGVDARAFVVGLAHAVDPTATLSRHPLTAPHFRGLETAEEGEARLKALGKPSLRGRNDLLLHFACSAAVATVATPEAAEAGGISKEAADMRPGGSGFSFADLLADLAGIQFAAWVAGDPKARLASLAKGFRGAEYCPDPAGQPEGLAAEAFAREYGSVSDERFRKKVAALKEEVGKLAVYGKEK